MVNGPRFVAAGHEANGAIFFRRRINRQHTVHLGRLSMRVLPVAPVLMPWRKRSEFCGLQHQLGMKQIDRRANQLPHDIQHGIRAGNATQHRRYAFTVHQLSDPRRRTFSQILFPGDPDLGRCMRGHAFVDAIDFVG